MRLVIQRVKNAKVIVDEKITGQIEKGVLVFVGIENEDRKEDIEWLCGKLIQLRIFDDQEGVMNLNVKDINGDILVISQFTLHAAIKKGNRPSYIKAAKPELAIPLYNDFIETLQLQFKKKVATGVFGADMQVILQNDGPVTIWMDSKNRV